MRSGSTSLLIDAGLSARQTGLRLAEIGVKLEELDAILVTHEHRDHLLGAKVLTGRHQLPIYLNQATLQVARRFLDHRACTECFDNGTPFEIGGLTIEAFSISHDAVDPVGFIIHAGQYKIAIATDLGYVSNLVREKLKGSHLMVLESNHDLEMLKNGPYPWDIKQRVWGRQGHLSNKESAALLKELYHADLKHVVLAHVSEVNNHKDLVWRETQKALAECALHEVSCSVASQSEVGRPIYIA